MSRHILVVDDESGIRELLADILGDEGYRVTLAENATAARAARAVGRRRVPQPCIPQVGAGGDEEVRGEEDGGAAGCSACARARRSA